MMYDRFWLVLLWVSSLALGCRHVAPQASPAPSATQSHNTQILKQYLHERSGKQLLFGQQDALAYGVGWAYEQGRSDVHSLVADQPAVLGWDIGRIGHTHNLDGVPFEWMRNQMVLCFERGGINTVSWHTYNPIDSTDAWHTQQPVVRHLIPGGQYHHLYKARLALVADFFRSVQTKDGVRVPIIFRPFHELDGNWFWWGRAHCTPQEYIALFRFTIEHLRSLGVDNLLVAYAPDRIFDTPEAYLSRYPGDDVVDLLGLDDYYDFGQPQGDSLVIARLETVARLANERQKLCAFTETGNEGVRDTTWYTERLSKIWQHSELTRRAVYVMVWRNHNTKHHYVPYPGHAAADNFRQFYAQEHTTFGSQVKVPYVYR